MIRNWLRLRVRNRTTTTDSEAKLAAAPHKVGGTSMSDEDRRATQKSLIILAVTFAACLLACGLLVYMLFPQLHESEKQLLKLPRTIEDAKGIANVLDRYKDMYYFPVMGSVVITYIFLQTFAIPGSLFLSILFGFLYEFPIALLLVCACSSIGASFCYCLSMLIGCRVAQSFCPKKMQEWSRQVDSQRNNLFTYIVFLRMTPVLPNWFINLASPIIGIPLRTFALATFIGVALPSTIAITAGQSLQSMSSTSDGFSWTSMGWLMGAACLTLVWPYAKSRLTRSRKPF